MRYLLNSAVIPTGCFGGYEYDEATVEDLRAFLRTAYASRIGYAETADAIAAMVGARPPLSREPSTMAPGDEAMVVRLRYRVGAGAKTARRGVALGDWEIGLLRRVR